MVQLLLCCISMKRFGLLSMIGLFAWLGVSSEPAHATTWLMTAKTTRVHCANGSHIFIGKGTFLQLDDELNRETYVVRLPIDYQRRCPVGKISTFNVWDLGTFGHEPKTSETPRVQKRRTEKEADQRQREEEDYFPNSPGYVLSSGSDANLFFRKITKSFAPLCRQKFLGSEGLGSWAEHAKDVMSISFFEETLDINKKAFARVCPAYKTMNVEQKKNLFVLSMMAQFNWESSCREKAANYKCPNGTCYGVAQLHYGREQRYISKKALKPYCPAYASTSARKSITCTIAMFIQDLWQGESVVGNSDSYWETVLPGNRFARRYEELFAQIPDCQKKTKNLKKRRSTHRSTQLAKSQDSSIKRKREIITPIESTSNRVPIGTL